MQRSIPIFLSLSAFWLISGSALCWAQFGAPPLPIPAPPPEPVQVPHQPGAIPPAAAPAGNPSNQPPSAEELVSEIRILGNEAHSESFILSRIHTRAGRPLEPATVNEDVKRLLATRKFIRVTPSYLRQSNPPGVTVIFQVDERPVLRYVRFVGNDKFPDRTLYKKCGIKKGEGLDPFAIEDARMRIEEYYHEKGYSKAQVSVFEGNKPDDKGAVFLISEGQLQKIRWVSFEGNSPSIATDARLRKVIESGPPLLWIFKGYVDREKIDADVDRLTAYYRDLGFFRAEIGRELLWDDDNKWLHLKFVINEGPRYHVRNVSFIGNQKYPSDDFASELKLNTGRPFTKADLNQDLSKMADFYGGRGYIFHDIQPETRFLDEPGQLDLVYKITEGDRWRVGRINVHIAGDNPHTRQTTVLNRMSLRPGDIIDTRELRSSERRLIASQLFETDRAKGSAPKVVYGKPDLDDIEAEVAGRQAPPPGYRGQSPDSPHRRLPAHPNNQAVHPGLQRPLETLRLPTMKERP